ncbi:glycosyltransferase family 39 protein [Tsukamurella sp. 8F]|uniref:ArnT family glycosyltransferase n=1 Tax=unclassified Tsukamurella TaxID=2633480 RepID=UPI0023B9665B|nr:MULTISPECIES: glycosyltransferase family 39 protein [unclassified Tsukamurella]MDF0528628.1 glycosyltransferase family 39 protein [Tsukamurella sp. 8J]MDF0585590.1 glycosyltransferase family 39 protein [Tsukamurella sp. 8F]
MITAPALQATPAPPPRIAARTLAGITAAVALVMLVASRNYGYFFDEAYFVVAGRDHTALGYFDQPPLVPWLAAAMDAVAPGNLVVLRLPATLAVAAVTLLAGLIARELGGRAGAQALAAAATAMTLVSTVGHWLATYSIDPLWWTLIVYLLARWTRTREDRLVLAAGAVTGLSLETKFLVPALWCAVGVGALVCGPRRLLALPALWGGAGVALVLAAPTLAWQATHGWPYARMGAVVRDEYPGAAGFAMVGVVGAGLFVGVPLLVIGVTSLLRSRRYRYLGVALLLVIAAIALAHGRSYYLASVYALPIAAGSVAVERWTLRRARARWWAALTGSLAVASAVCWFLASPVWSPGVAKAIGHVPGRAPATLLMDADRMTRSFADEATTAYRSLSPAERSSIAIVAESYPFAAAVDVYGPAAGLPRAYSGHRGYYYFGRPSDSVASVLWLGEPSTVLDRAFASRRRVADDAWLYTGRRLAWPALWEQLRAR